MKIKNKQTGETAEASILNSELVVHYDDGRVERYSLLSKHYEEPKEYWTIDMDGEVKRYALHSFNSQITENIKSIGNYFSSQEEAEKAVERLKKLQNLKNRGYNIDEYIDMIIERGEE